MHTLHYSHLAQISFPSTHVVDIPYVKLKLFIDKIMFSLEVTQSLSLKVLKGLLPIKVQGPPYKLRKHVLSHIALYL